MYKNTLHIVIISLSHHNIQNSISSSTDLMVLLMMQKVSELSKITLNHLSPSSSSNYHLSVALVDKVLHCIIISYKEPAI